MPTAATKFLLCLLIVLTGSACAAEGVRETPYMKIFETHGEFADVYQFVELAITDKGMKINNVSHIGKMLERTAEAVGKTKVLYREANALEFCSAVVSRDMMTADPNNIVFCPYIIYVYQLPGDDDTVYVAYRKPWAGDDPARNKALAPVTELLESIISEAIQ